jgi:CRP-like cAMP-binding protein
MNRPETDDADEPVKSAELTMLGLNLIARMPEFHYLTRAEVASLARRQPKVYRKGETIIAAGSDDESVMAILLAGACKINAPLFLNDRQVHVCVEHISAPAVFGEVIAFSSAHCRRTVNVVAARRSIAILVPATLLKIHFERSKTAAPVMLWSFATLGLARVRASSAKFNRLVEKYVKAKGRLPLNLEDEAQAIEDLIGSSPEKASSAVNEEVFDSIAAMLDKVNSALALVSYFDQLRDHQLPSVSSLEPAPSGVSKLALDTLSGHAGPDKSIKQAVAETMAARFVNPGHETAEWKPYLEEMANAVEDLLGLASTYYTAHDRRHTTFGAGPMIDGFVKRMEREMDKTMEDAKERFDIVLPISQLEKAPNLDRIASFFQSRMDSLKIRNLSLELDRAGQDEFIRDETQIRDHVAIDVYNRLSRHPVLRVVMQSICETQKSCPKLGDTFDITLLDLFCLGCRLIYPPLDETKNMMRV